MQLKNILRILFGVMIFSLLLQASKIDNKLDKELLTLTTSQKVVLMKTFMKAKKIDLEYTMTAIAWQESRFGKHKINLSDPSFGIFHNQINSVCKREKSCTDWAKSRNAELLVSNFDFSFKHSSLELMFWKQYWKKKGGARQWSRMVQSYNAGFNFWNGKKYLIDIKQKIKALKRFVKNNEQSFKILTENGDSYGNL